MFHVKHSAPYVYRSASPAAQLPEPTLKMCRRRIFFTLRRETFRPSTSTVLLLRQHSCRSLC